MYSYLWIALPHDFHLQQEAPAPAPAAPISRYNCSGSESIRANSIEAGEAVWPSAVGRAQVANALHIATATAREGEGEWEVEGQGACLKRVKATDAQQLPGVIE